jgi:hypothetical protein
MTSSHRRLASIAITACCAVPAAGALAAQASAATLAADKACYANPDPELGAPMIITGAGFIPGTTVTLNGVSDLVPPSAVADASGNVSIPAHAPELNLKNFTPGAGTRTVSATADNPDGSQTTASVPVRAADLSVATTPSSVRDVRKDKVTFSFAGFVAGKHIFGYWRSKNKTVGTTKFGKAHGPCGLLKEKALLFPGGRPKKDSYKVTFESTSKFSNSVFPRVTGTLNILHF